MTGGFTIDDVVAERLGQEIVDSSVMINGYLNEISALNTDIATAWKGTDATTYCDRINSQLEALQMMKKTIEETGVYIQEIARGYRQRREGNSNYSA